MANIIGDTFAGMLGGFGGVFKFISDIFPILIVLLIGGLIGWYFLEMLKYNKIIKVKRLVGDKVINIEDRAKYIIDREGVHHWKFRKLKILAPIPPEKILTFSEKGKEVAECWLTPNGDVLWFTARFSIDEMIKLAEKSKNKTELTQEEAEALNFSKYYKPITTSQRSSWAYQQMKREKYLKKDVTQYVPIAMSGIFLIVMFIVISLFWGKIVEPINTASATINEGKKLDLEILTKLQEIQNDVQVIKEAEKINFTNNPGALNG